MNVKKTIKKIAALGAGVTMVGATVMGAMAYDLANYPAPFVVDGVSDSTIVLGSTGTMEDMLGAVDIAASLQAEAVSSESVKIPGKAGEVSLEGDNVKIETSNDVLELREPIGEVLDTITEDDLTGLKSGHLSTSEGDTDYYQYLRLKDGTLLSNVSVNYVEDENNDDVMGPYLVLEADDDSPFMEWEIQFPEGFESSLDDCTDAGNNCDLDDYDDKSFNILGKDLTVVTAEIDDDSTDFAITLMGGSLSDTLREGETKTYTLNGVEYEVTLVFVSDPQSGGNVEAKFWVNGEVTPAMAETETEMVGGIQLGVRDILANARDGVASFFLGADKLEIDTTVTDGSDDADFAGNVEINQETIGEGKMQILGSFTDSTNETWEMTSMKYQLAMDSDEGGTAYVNEGQGVKELMEHPESFISDTLDIKYEGLTEVETTNFEVKLSGDDKYKIVFTNIQGEEYSFPYVSYDGGTWKFGDEDDDLIFAETGDNSFQIGDDDYFVLTNDRTDGYKSVSNVLRYDDYDDNTRTVELKDVGTDKTHKVTVSATDGEGSLVVGGHTYTIDVENVSASSPNIEVDLNGDSDVATDKVDITAKGGLVVDLAYNIAIHADHNMTVNASVMGDGKDLEYDFNATDTWDVDEAKVWLNASIDSSLFDTTTADEWFNFYVKPVDTGTEVDLEFDEGDYHGPLAGQFGNGVWDEFQFKESQDDSDVYVGMTDYGVLIERDEPSDDPAQLKLMVPETQVTGQVFITLGSVTAVEGSAGGIVSDTVNPIAVGLAVLDTQAPPVGTENLIVVGGPCVNNVAAQLLGFPSECTTGFVSGKALIKSFENNGMVSLLVAGMDAQDTQGASRVLADYADYDLAGSEVEVVVASLNDLTVQAVTEMPGDDDATDIVVDDNETDDMGNETA